MFGCNLVKLSEFVYLIFSVRLIDIENKKDVKNINYDVNMREKHFHKKIPIYFIFFVRN